MYGIRVANEINNGRNPQHYTLLNQTHLQIQEKKKL
jgi:hypothetical protein